MTEQEEDHFVKQYFIGFLSTQVHRTGENIILERQRTMVRDIFLEYNYTPVFSYSSNGWVIVTGIINPPAS